MAKVKFVLVAFRYNQKKSLIYVDSDTPEGLVPYLINSLRNENADVISIRRAYEACPTPPSPTS